MALSVAKRRALLRARLKAHSVAKTFQPVGQFRAANPETRLAQRPKMPPEDLRHPSYFLINFGNANDGHRPQWVEMPEPMPVDPKVPQVKRRNGVPPLVKMAEKLLEKLPVVAGEIQPTARKAPATLQNANRSFCCDKRGSLAGRFRFNSIPKLQ